jgi:hypothetical protein
MHRRGKSTRQRLVDSDLFLFWQDGYAATGVAEILARAKVKCRQLLLFLQNERRAAAGGARILHPDFAASGHEAGFLGD